MENFTKLTILGSGAAMAVKQYNTCFAFSDANGECLLVDAGGGNGILQRLSDANIAVGQIKSVFVTHSHTDHILGILWIIRQIAAVKDEQYKCDFYMAEQVYNDLMTLCSTTMTGHIKRAKEKINFHIVKHMEAAQIGGNKFTFFDTFYNRVQQFAFKIETEACNIGFCGDIPLAQENYELLSGCGLLIHEAFCDSTTKEKYNVEKIGHCTAKDAGKIASAVNAESLMIIHKTDEFMNNGILKNDAKSEFDRTIFVPEDGSVFELRGFSSVPETKIYAGFCECGVKNS